jgi:hypothetical protein
MPTVSCGFDDAPPGVSGCDLLTALGPTVLVDIGFDPNFVPGSGVFPNLAVKGLPALVDTGAGESCIDNILAAQLSLSVIDRRLISGVHGAKLTNMYLAQVHIPALPFTIWGAFAGVDLIAGGSPHRALIGRTFLARFTMVYSGITGKVTITSNP